MKTVFLIALLLGVFSVQAQTNADYMDLIKSTAKIELKSFVYEGLSLSEEQKSAFDPIFNKYIDQTGAISLKKAALFDSYASDAGTFSIDQINDLNKEILKTDLQKVKTDKKFYGKFVKAIGVEKATEFFFLKKYLDNSVESAKLDFLLE